MLDALFNPQSIAVIGASADSRKVGHAVLANLKKFGFTGALYPVNPTATEILGSKAYPSVAAIQAPLDLVVIVIPAKAVPAALRQCAEAGARAAIVISAGFKEAGADGTILEEELKTISREQGIRVLGPNCLGLINTANSMNATFAADMLPRGKIAFFSQSGAMGIAIMDWAIGNEIGFSKFVSLGNKADLSEIDFIEYCIDDPETSLILGYIEDVVDGKRFMDVARRATAVKPIILLKSGGTAAGARAASSHTGALAGSDTAFDAAFIQTGVMRARGVQDLFDTALAFAEGKVPRGEGLLVVTNAGGPGIIAADTAEQMHVDLPYMTKESILAVAGRLPPNATVFNPVDVIGDATSARYAVVLEQAAQDPNVDAILVILTPQAMTDVEETARAVIAVAKTTAKPMITAFMGEARVRSAIKLLKDASIPNFSYPELAIKAFRKLADYAAWQARGPEALACYEHSFAEAAAIVAAVRERGETRLGEDDAAKVLACYGFRFPKRMLARTSAEAVHAAEKIGFPVVMKIASPDILHKTDVGGVRVGLKTAKEAEAAFTEITSNAHRVMPQAFLAGVTVSEMVQGGKEVILGVTLDRTFGHLLMFGLGGIYVEVLKDVAFRVAPVTLRDAQAMLTEIRTIALLRGARGERPADLDAIARAIVGLSCFVTDFPDLQELDINPLLALEQGTVALDARMIFKGKDKPGKP